MAHPLQDGQSSHKAISHGVQPRRQTASLHKSINACQLIARAIKDVLSRVGREGGSYDQTAMSISILYI